jgi:tetratricopeptide repeat protein/adenylate/guanylate cyclase family protein
MNSAFSVSAEGSNPRCPQPTAPRPARPWTSLSRNAVHHFEGTVNQVMGDGIMALFRAPLAHEDHAVRAAYAALRMQEVMGRYAEERRRQQGLDVQLRVGLHSGEVVVCAIGSDLALLGSDPSLAPLTQLLIVRTQGNPFFLEESVRTLVETGGLVGERSAYRLAQPLESLQVPATIQTVLAARIDRLPPEEKQLLQTAAVIGQAAEQVERLAHHALRGEVWDKAVPYCQQAGGRARDRAAPAWRRPCPRRPPHAAQAETHYQQALALANDLGMRPLVAHCHLGLGQLYGQTGRGELARTALTAAIELYRAMDMTFWLSQAETALAQVEEQERSGRGSDSAE